ncbi:type ISP restriction/modification enzyme [Mycobacterium sp. JS623]|uniref:type ISP restriction/modification enzyme n=1 Tax=Mycobacterium sp. JS623 TaxID=212767 RepID=UPI0018E03751
MPWFSPEVFPTRTWVYSPSESTLKRRWTQLLSAPGLEERRAVMKDSTGAINQQFKNLPGHDHGSRLPTMASLSDTPVEPIVTVGFRAFDRQLLIADPRLIPDSCFARGYLTSITSTTAEAERARSFTRTVVRTSTPDSQQPLRRRT